MMYGLWAFLLGFCAGNFPHFSPMITRDFNGFSADGDRVTDRLPDRLTDESNDVQMEGNFLEIGLSGNFIQQYLWVFSP